MADSLFEAGVILTAFIFLTYIAVKQTIEKLKHHSLVIHDVRKESVFVKFTAEMDYVSLILTFQTAAHSNG